jgi:hypothetical protein
MANDALKAAEIEAFAVDWYRKLDGHAPMVEVLPMLSPDGLRMAFPEAALGGLAAFEGWYQGVIRIFFDEAHKVTLVKPTIKGATAVVKIIVRWEASRWKPPAARSERIVLDAFQTWKVRRSAATGGLEITEYVVDRLKYVKGSAKL